MSRLPLIGVTACSGQVGLHAYHISGDKYVRALAVAAKGLPVILPSLVDILDGLDGVLFTGTPSNVEPFRCHGSSGAPVQAQYAPNHPMHTQPGGALAGLGLQGDIPVNSIHGQGVERLAPGLRAEALAPGGLTESISVAGSRAFASGVQGHPQWQVSSNPHHLASFQAFGDACRKRAIQRDADASENA